MLLRTDLMIADYPIAAVQLEKMENGQPSGFIPAGQKASGT